MADLQNLLSTVVGPAMALLPARMDSDRVRVLLLAIGLQESRFQFRRQMGNGPARGFWQFEQGATASSGVRGVFNHALTGDTLRRIAVGKGIQPTAAAIWAALETDDVLACVTARLLIYTDGPPLPALGDSDGAWRLYADRCWRPGKPHPETWPANYAQALQAVTQ